MGQCLGASVGVAILQLVMNIFTDKYDLDTGLRAVFYATVVLGVLLILSIVAIKKTAPVAESKAE